MEAERLKQKLIEDIDASSQLSDGLRNDPYEMGDLGNNIGAGEGRPSLPRVKKEKGVIPGCGLIQITYLYA